MIPSLFVHVISMDHDLNKLKSIHYMSLGLSGQRGFRDEDLNSIELSVDLPPHEGNTIFSRGLSGLYKPSSEQGIYLGAGRYNCWLLGHSSLQISLLETEQ